MKAALVGRGIGASKTPAMHEAEARAQGFRYSYDLIDAGTDEYRHLDLADIIARCEADGFTGLNITHPFKIAVIPFLDDLSGTARAVGAVNTIVFRNGKRIGHNTDYSGFTFAFRRDLRDAGRGPVLLLGAGGGGAAVALALVDCGVGRLFIHDNDTERAAHLANRLSIARPERAIVALGDLTKIDLSDLAGMVNATPMGMAEHPGAAIEADRLSPTTWVADIVYFPLETQLLKRARDRGCRVMNGSSMAIGQAIDAFAMMTGREADPERFHACFDRLIAKETGAKRARLS